MACIKEVMPNFFRYLTKQGALPGCEILKQVQHDIYLYILLLSKRYRARLPYHRNLDLAWVGHFRLDTVRDICR